MKNVIYDTEAENELISRITSYGEMYFGNCLKYLDENCFSSQLGKDWFTATKSLYEQGNAISLLSIILESEKLGLETKQKDYITISNNCSSEDPSYIAAYLLDLKRRRFLFAKCVTASDKVTDTSVSVEDVTETLREAINDSSLQTDAFVTLKDTGYSLIDDCQKLINGEFTSGIPCGFRYIDNKGGLQFSDLNIVAGTTSAGKTSLTLAMALGAVKSGYPTALYSLEMSLKQLTARLVSIESGIPSSKILSKPLDYQEMEVMCNTISALSNYPMFFDEKCTTDIAIIEQSIRSLAYYHGVRLAVIDYVQLLTGREKEKRDRIASAANRLKSLAKELNICIVLVSQLARPAGGEIPIPRLSQLKESGDLENAADNVFLVYRPEWFVGRNLSYPDMTEDWSKYSTKGTGLLIQAKGRNTSLGECLLGYDGKTTHFYDINVDEHLLSNSGFTEDYKKPPF